MCVVRFSQNKLFDTSKKKQKYNGCHFNYWTTSL